MCEEGVQLHGKGLSQQAVERYQRCLNLQPDHPEARNNLAIALQLLGRTEEAIPEYEKVLFSHPDFAQSHNNLATALQSLGKWKVAVHHYKRALELRPEYVDALRNLGQLWTSKGEALEAIDFYRQLRSKSESTQLLHELGLGFQKLGETQEALACFKKALRRTPNDPNILNNLGNVHQELGRLESALEFYRKSISLCPHKPHAWNNLGLALQKLERPDEAMESFSQAMTADPEYEEASLRMGVIADEQGKWREAKKHYQKALKIQPDYAEAHYNLGMLLLRIGRFNLGWRAHEWRLKTRLFVKNSPAFAQPLWDGSPMGSKTLLIRTEQGLGDAIQFIRFLPLAAERCKRILLQCPQSLLKLFACAKGAQSVVAWLPITEKTRSFDRHVSLMSLPALFQTELDSIPAAPYLTVENSHREYWKKRLEPDSATRRVGLVWSGGKRHRNDRKRSLALDELAALFDVPDVSFYSLQKGTPAEQTARHSGRIVDLTSEIDDFLDTAALIMELDLVIGVDTSVIHLAGALGKPVWTLLPYPADWRWMLERSHTPWYPAMRLFRQSHFSDWGQVIQKVAGALKQGFSEQKPATDSSSFMDPDSLNAIVRRGSKRLLCKV